jgi:hypothetical protein
MLDFELHNIVGSLGVIMIITSYLFIQIDKMSVKGVQYSLINAVGALLVLFSLYYEFNLSAFIIELFWLIISLYGLFNFYRKS